MLVNIVLNQFKQLEKYLQILKIKILETYFIVLVCFFEHFLNFYILYICIRFSSKQRSSSFTMKCGFFPHIGLNNTFTGWTISRSGSIVSLVWSTRLFFGLCHFSFGGLCRSCIICENDTKLHAELLFFESNTTRKFQCYIC